MNKRRIMLPDIFFTGLLVLLFITSFISYQRINSQTETSNLLNTSYRIKNRVNQVLSDLLNAETGVRGFLLTKKQTFLQPYYGASDKVETSIDVVKELLENDAQQQKNADSLRILSVRSFELLSLVLKENETGVTSADSLDIFFDKGKFVMDNVRSLVTHMLEIEDDLISRRKLQQEYTAFITPLYSLLFSLIAIIIVTIAFFRLRNEMRLRVRAEDNEAMAQQLQETAKNFAAELEIKVAERTEQLKKLNEELTITNNIYAHAEENASIGSYSWNMQSGELKYSDNLFRLLGYEPGDFMPTFESFLRFIHPDDKEQVIRDGKETFETKTLVEHDYRIITKQGSIRHMRSSGRFIENENSTLLIGTVQDVSKDVLLRETLAAKNLELEQNNEELESFTYIASHDLQEPLRKIQSFSKLILAKETELAFSEAAKDYFNRIVSAAARMQNLINALLSYSNASKQEIQFKATNLNLVIEEVKTNLTELLDERKVTIECGKLPTVPGIQMQLVQLFSNLIHNAVKYSKKGSAPHIIINAQLLADEASKAEIPGVKGKFWKIAIADNGIGFDQQYEHKIFELFQRLHGRSAYEGTGIGLAICKKIMHNHNGFITASGQTGIGAIFNLYLPCQDELVDISQ
ncbi:CHASE3 domain-containing protein [Ferruginibacter paludis]|uniref:sensor histidine kinase n=1 Tax=Ferruginibacter paludis TaxID=1310417 RepID=UPI0025B28C56|nr:CHASE3 domain-containing protein [Ferruginibacter paludis]MDN3655440.1 CHASE3 domain-containing protein [Ferruginibacter paludis]